MYNYTRFFIVQRVKDSLYYMSTDDKGEHTFVSSLKYAHKFIHLHEADEMVRSMQNWLKRPKFKLVIGKTISVME
jgi:hypothetical protein